MSKFSDEQLEYLRSQPLGRIATVGPDMRPHVTPVAFFYDAEEDAIVTSSVRDMTATKKFRDAQRNPDVAFVVDDTGDGAAFQPRGIEIRGIAVAHTEGGEEVGRRVGAGFTFHPAYLSIHPRRIRAWGFEPAGDSGSARERAGAAAE